MRGGYGGSGCILWAMLTIVGTHCMKMFARARLVICTMHEGADPIRFTHWQVNDRPDSSDIRLGKRTKTQGTLTSRRPDRSMSITETQPSFSLRAKRIATKLASDHPGGQALQISGVGAFNLDRKSPCVTPRFHAFAELTGDVRREHQDLLFVDMKAKPSTPRPPPHSTVIYKSTCASRKKGCFTKEQAMVLTRVSERSADFSAVAKCWEGRRTWRSTTTPRWAEADGVSTWCMTCARTVTQGANPG